MESTTGFVIISGGGQYSFGFFECSLTNSYVLYRKFHQIHDRKPPLTHYEFNRAVALAWLKPSAFWSHRSSRLEKHRNNGTSVTTDSTIASSIVTRKKYNDKDKKNAHLTSLNHMLERQRLYESLTWDFHRGTLTCNSFKGIVYSLSVLSEVPSRKDLMTTLYVIDWYRIFQNFFATNLKTNRHLDRLLSQMIQLIIQKTHYIKDSIKFIWAN